MMPVKSLQVWRPKPQEEVKGNLPRTVSSSESSDSSSSDSDANDCTSLETRTEYATHHHNIDWETVSDASPEPVDCITDTRERFNTPVHK